MTLNKKMRWGLIDEVAHMCEKSYRRGFQQGANCVSEHENDIEELLSALTRWRFLLKNEINGDFYAYADSIAPPWKHPSLVEHAVVRLGCELGKEATPQLSRLLGEYMQCKNHINK